jgi:tRNA threonylcarbamoyladenosine biosynthesis protein TsaB
LRVLAFDTATPATVVAARDGDAEVVERRHDPGPGERPGHVAQLLALAAAALSAAGFDWLEIDRVGVGVGPGTFTGLRIGVATARSLAQATGAQLVGVSTLDALARATGDGRPVLAVLDARRGEAFVAAYEAGRRTREPLAARPEDLAALVAPGALAVGDGAVRFRSELEAAGASVPEDTSPLHRVAGDALLRLAAAAPEVSRPALLPEYVRPPDARPRSEQ